MLIKVPIDKLKVGVFVEDQRLKSLQPPFPSAEFKINDYELVNQLRNLGFSDVYINTEKGLDVTKTGKKLFIGFPIEVLLINQPLPFDLFIKKQYEYVPILNKGQSFNDEIYTYLKYDYELEKVFVTASSKDGAKTFNAPKPFCVGSGT